MKSNLNLWRLVLPVLASTLTYASVGMASDSAVHTNKNRFRIPYRYDAVEMQRIGAKEIHLYVSADRGKNWRLGRKVEPRIGKFDYETPGDGEYWFAVRTLDARNQLVPGGKQITPGLKVVVDTQAPTLQVRLRQVTANTVEAQWSANDAGLDASSFKLESIQTGQQNWNPVRVKSAAAGKVTWEVTGGGFVAVHASISDRAGNTKEIQSQTQVQQVAEPRPQPGPTLRDLDGPVAGIRGPAFQSEPIRRESNPGELLPPVPDRRDDLINDSIDTRPGIVQGRYPNDPRPPRQTKKTRVVGTKRFQIGYQVEDVGPSGVGEVELFITEDDGRKWYRYGKDNDSRSPVEAQVPQDGIYGFAIRVQSGTGLASPPPRAGDKPDVVVVVDQTPPAVRLLPVQQGRGANSDKVVIRWQVSDQYPTERPVALSYATNPNGIWEPISGWMENTGSYVWQAGPNLPPQIYLRVTARDAAGNMNRDQSTQPVLIDLTRPSARIIDVESLR